MKNKIILSIPLYANTKDQFIQKWEEKLERDIRKATLGNEISNESLRSELRDLYLNINPRFYRYNDIVGYAELEIDDEKRDILIFYHMNGDLRKKYNKLSNKINKKAIYQGAYDRTSVIRYETSDNNRIRECIRKAIGEIELKCNEWLIHFDNEYYINQIEYFDYKKKFNDDSLRNS